MLTPKQERFCQLYVETSNQSKAYRGAYDTSRMNDSSVHRKAHEVMHNVKVTARINELMAEHAERHRMTVDDLLAELEEAREFARGVGQSGTLVTATMGKAKLLGLDKPDDGKPDIVINNIMPVPTADSVDDWESTAMANQDDLLKR